MVGSGGRWSGGVLAVVVVAFPLGDQGVAVRLQGGVERGGVHARSVIRSRWRGPSVVLVIERCRFGARGGVGAGFEFDCGAQLGDGGDLGQLRRSGHRSPRRRVLGDDADLIQRQPALAHPVRAAGELLEPAGDGRDGVRRCAVTAGLPGDQRRHRPGPGHPAQLVAVHLGDDLHDAPIDGVALTGQLRQLLEEHLNSVFRAQDRRGLGFEHRFDSSRIH